MNNAAFYIFHPVRRRGPAKQRLWVGPGRYFCGGGGSTPTPTPTDSNPMGSLTNAMQPGGAPMPYSAAGKFAASDGTFVYSGGGLSNNGIVHNDLVRYDPVADSWTSLPPSPDYYALSQAVYFNGKIYNFGGYEQPFSLPTRPGFMISALTCGLRCTDAGSIGERLPHFGMESFI